MKTKDTRIPAHITPARPPQGQADRVRATATARTTVYSIPAHTARTHPHIQNRPPDRLASAWRPEPPQRTFHTRTYNDRPTRIGGFPHI